VDEATQPERVGDRLQALRGELVVDEPAIRAANPAFERVCAERLSRPDRLENRWMAKGARPVVGRAGLSREREHVARDREVGARRLERRALALRIGTHGRRQRARKHAGARGLGRIGHRVGEPPGERDRLLGRLRVLAQQVQHLVDER
jgi:hypothetical protein